MRGYYDQIDVVGFRIAYDGFGNIRADLHGFDPSYLPGFADQFCQPLAVIVLRLRCVDDAGDGVLSHR